MSEGFDMRPMGMVARNFARFSGVFGTPMNISVMPVSPITGQRQLTRMLSLASSAAIDLVSVIAAPLEPLYQVRPGRGRMPAVDAVVMIEPPPWARITGTTL